MGKPKKNKLRGQGDPVGKNAPLADQIIGETVIKSSKRSKTRQHQEESQFVDDRLTKKILSQAREQQEELETEYGASSSGQGAREKTTKLRLDGEDSDVDSDLEGDSNEMMERLHQQGSYENLEVSEEDERAIKEFMNQDAPVRRTLADFIMEKITEKQTEVASQMSDSGLPMPQLDSRIIEVYKGVKTILSQYRSGKLPKAFKIIPALTNWEQVLYITEPENWSAASVYQATRLFASNLNANMAQRFYNLVLLPRVRDDIVEYKKLNFHLYAALKKSVFKPAAFYKGIILPLCESGTCTLREAMIIGSVITKCSLPMLHSSAAMLKIAEMNYYGANSIFLRLLFDKKYALPFRVIDAAIFHFYRFVNDRRRAMPVLWHQCLLTFVQRYKEDISSDQKEMLLDTLKTHSHPQITPEIRYELQNSKCRDVEETYQEPPPMDYEDTMTLSD